MTHHGLIVGMVLTPTAPTNLRITPLSTGPSLHVRWAPQASPLPVTAWTIYKRVPGPVENWVLVRLQDNTPQKTTWTDTAVLPRQEWCYRVGALATGWVASVAQSPAACGVAP